MGTIAQSYKDAPLAPTPGFQLAIAACFSVSSSRRHAHASVPAKTRKGLTLREEIFPRESYLDIRTRQTGHINNQPRFKIELLADGRAIALAQWVKPEDAETFVAAVKRAIG